MKAVASAPAPATAPTSQPSSAPAKKAVPDKLVQAAKSLVTVHYYFKKDLAEEAGRNSWPSFRARMYERYVDDKITLDASGLVIAPGRVLVYDNGLESRFIERIEIRTADGKTFAATREKLLENCSGEILRVEGDLPAPTFKPVEKIDLSTTLRAAGLMMDDDRWYVDYNSLSPLTVYGSAGNFYFSSPGKPPAAGHVEIADTADSNLVQLIADSDGNPVGACVDAMLDARQDEVVWKGADLLASPGLSADELAKKQTALHDKLLKSVFELRMKFRPAAPDERDADGLAGKEIPLYCFAISDKQAVIPQLVSRRIAAKIESIDVKFDQASRSRCRFVGAFAEFGASVIELENGTFPGFIPVAKADPVAIKPLWAATPRERNGKTDVDLTVNRLVGKKRGYRNHFNWQTARVLPQGALLLTLDGQLAGLNVLQRVENEEQRSLEKADDRSAQSATGPVSRIFTAGELAAALADPAVALDAKIKSLPKNLAKRRHWLGVEFVGMNKDLAEQMKVQGHTKDGSVGFLVSAVYPGSPAEKMGLHVGDVLLSLKVEGQPYPVDLASNKAARAGGDDEDDTEVGPAPRTWKSRDNFITKLLDTLADNTKVQVTYFDCKADPDKCIVTRTFVSQTAPPDYDSADKWKNRKIGLTVKDLTYELRTALNLKDADSGVVVANVESGTPGSLARIWPNEIITRLDEQLVTSARGLRDAIAAAKSAGKDKVRLTILRLGKTRFADLTVKDYNAADDEDLEPTSAPAK